MSSSWIANEWMNECLTTPQHENLESHAPKCRSHLSVYVQNVSDGPDIVTFEQQPPGAVEEGTSLNIKCVAQCHPSCRYSWTRGTRTVSSTSLLRLTNIHRNQTGAVYTCTVRNSAISKSKSKQFTLNVVCKY